MKNLLFCFFFSSVILPSCAQTKSLEYFEGEWDFRIWFTGNDSEKADLTARWYLEKGLDSAECYIGHVEMNEADFTREIIAFDSKEKKYERTIIADNGAYFQMKTNGWENDELIWKGVQSFNGSSTEIKEVIVKINEDQFQAEFYTRNGNDWLPTQKEILTRKK